MQTIDCGSATGVLLVDEEGIGTVVFTGLLLPSNFLSASVLAMRAGVEHGARGLIYRIEQAAIAFSPEVLMAAYPDMAPTLRARPVAFVTNLGQVEIYRQVVQRATKLGLIRRQFLVEAEARDWLRQTLSAMDENRHWWARRAGHAAGVPPTATPKGDASG